MRGRETASEAEGQGGCRLAAITSQVHPHPSPAPQAHGGDRLVLNLAEKQPQSELEKQNAQQQPSAC